MQAVFSSIILEATGFNPASSLLDAHFCDLPLLYKAFRSFCCAVPHSKHVLACQDRWDSLKHFSLYALYLECSLEFNGRACRIGLKICRSFYSAVAKKRRRPCEVEEGSCQQSASLTPLSSVSDGRFCFEPRRAEAARLRRSPERCSFDSVTNVLAPKEVGDEARNVRGPRICTRPACCCSASRGSSDDEHLAYLVRASNAPA